MVTVPRTATLVCTVTDGIVPFPLMARCCTHGSAELAAVKLYSTCSINGRRSSGNVATHSVDGAVWVIVLEATVDLGLSPISSEIVQSVPSRNAVSSRIESPPTAYVFPCMYTPEMVVARLEEKTAGAARKKVASTTSSVGSTTESDE
jgi:hypothetical protein